MTAGRLDTLPPLVADALRVADRLEFERSCSLQTGRLLRTLVAGVRSGVVGEIGTGAGVGAAWMASALREGASLVTVEIERELAEAARTLLSGVPRVQVIHGDWREILPFGPFALLFPDAVAAKEGDPERLLQALELGGLAVLDDLSPGRTSATDPLRDFWLNDPRLAASEVLVRPEEAVILATRIG